MNEKRATEGERESEREGVTDRERERERARESTTGFGRALILITEEPLP